jgi:hypothetical protein
LIYLLKYPLKYRPVFIPLLLFIYRSLVLGQGIELGPGPTQQVGKYRVSLRLPVDGLVASEEQQIELRLVDISRNDPVLGPPAVIRAQIQSSISMPAMPAMPRAQEIAHPEGVPGDYGLHPTFAHGGDYLLTLQIKSPVDEAFTVEFPLKVADEPANRRARPQPYSAELKTEPGRIKAGESTRLQITVMANLEMRDANGRPSGKRRMERVRDFDVMHERQMHLIIVRRDLEFFAHTHPTTSADGVFTLDNYVFPTAGEYRIFVDAAPKGAGGQVMSAAIRVEGKSKAEAPVSASANDSTRHIINGIEVTLKDARSLVPRRTLPYVVRLRDQQSGQPVRDLQPYLGAVGHLIMISENAETFVHAHPDERDPQNGKQGEITFLVRPPKPGRYHIWVEFQREGRVHTAGFTVAVEETTNGRGQ